MFGVALILALGAFAFYMAAGQPAPGAQVQPQSPVEELKLHLQGVHVIKEAPNRQYVAHHYCQQLREDLIQCAVFDSGEPRARLIDVEYVVPDDVYRSFSPEEQQYWHPHDYEVDSGLLRAPGLPPEQEREVLDTIRSTHGRTWHLWASKENPYPLGKPELAWSITGPGQLREDIERELGRQGQDRR
ncbi:MAG: DUF1264 domain-containing protein [Dehalococcoidales bacterium]|nr:DUF1264 domain-containing protein [Dehalococcoidales bacterium]